MTRAPYSLTGPIAPVSLGLAALSVDETVEQDFRRMFTAGKAALYVTRIPSGANLTPETIAGMERDLPAAIGLLPRAVSFDAIAYACTSGATLIGPQRIAALVREAADVRFATDPLTAAIAAFARLGVARIGLLSPYIESVSAPMIAAFEAAGLSVPERSSFGEQVEARVARIDPRSIRDAAVDLGGRAGVEAVFVSCTNLRALEVIDAIEAATGRPAVCSNQALAWAMAGAAGIAADGPGRLLRGAAIA